MKPSLLKTGLGQYVETAYSGKNESGATAFGDHVLILPDEAAEKTAGNVYIPEQLRERQGMASETGMLVAVGDDAFVWAANGHKIEGRKPKVGDRVYFTRYAGQELVGDDGKKYRLMTDACVGAIKAGK